MPTRKLFIVIIIFIIGILGFVIFRNKPGSLPTVEEPNPIKTKEILGKSVEGRNIESYTYGTGEKQLVFVGGIHGGYEWNSVLLSYQFIDYLDANTELLASNTKITIIPSLNPDGVYKVTGKEGIFTKNQVSTSTKVLASGRFNANNVDLNRNFDCKWSRESSWQGKKVSAGQSPFSEPEARVLRDFVSKNKTSIKAVVFWHSQANTVYASECKSGILPVTLDIMDRYSKAAGYLAVKKFDSYPITGDAEGWLASINIPAITVELKTHEDTEWNKNLAGIKALLDYFKN